MISDVAMLKRRISQRAGVKVAVIGIGYVGLPQAVELAKVGFSVIGVDINEDLVKQVRASKSTVEGLPSEHVKSMVDGGALTLLLVNMGSPAKTDHRALEALFGVDVFIGCVPTPLHAVKGREPDTTWIDEAAKLIAIISEMKTQGEGLPGERLVVLESTTYPGTMRELSSPR